MASGNFSIETLMNTTRGQVWRPMIGNQGMGQAFAKGAWHMLRQYNGGGFSYRLVKRNKDGSKEVLEQYNSGNISLN